MKNQLEFTGGPLDGEVHKVPTGWAFVVVPLRAPFQRCTGLPNSMSLEGAKTYVGSSSCGLYMRVLDELQGRPRMEWVPGA